MRKLGHIARKYDRGYGHFTTRQNLQLHWSQLPDVPDMLLELAEVEMHCMQTSGNCVRNITADHFAGAAADEIEDPRILSEILRQWSTLHPEFSFLPRKFKIAVSGSAADRAAIMVHDIGIQIVRNEAGEIGYRVFVGGGLGRAPFIGHEVGSFVPKSDILAFLESVMRVYNESGRRDNIHKARVKILVHQIGIDEMRRRVEAEFAEIKKTGVLELPAEEIARIAAYFAAPDFEMLPAECEAFETAKRDNRDFADWVKTNVDPHKMPGYAIATISLKTHRPDAGRLLIGPDGRPGRHHGRFWPSGNPRHARAESGAAAYAGLRSVRAVAKARAARSGDGQSRPRHRHHRLPGPGLLRSGQCALHPHRDRRSPNALPIWNASTISAS